MSTKHWSSHVFFLSSLWKHPDYAQDGSRGFPNDIAVMRLATTAATNPHTRAATMAPANSGDLAGSNCFISGWGRLYGKSIERRVNNIIIYHGVSTEMVELSKPTLYIGDHNAKHFLYVSDTDINIVVGRRGRCHCHILPTITHFTLRRTQELLRKQFWLGVLMCYVEFARCSHLSILSRIWTSSQHSAGG